MLVHTISALLCAILLGAVSVSAATGTRSAKVTCDTRTACFPWSPRGPFCGRGANINLRFQLQLTKSNYIISPALRDPISNVTYAFCPRVDELQAFNITNVGLLALTYQNETSGDIDFMEEGSDEIFLSAIGFGDQSNVEYPQPNTLGRVMIGDYFSRARDANAEFFQTGVSQCNTGTEIAVVTFAVLNVSLDNGKFAYREGYDMPAGTGFIPSCDDKDVCLFDGAMKCIGEGGNRHCAECMTREQARAVNVQIWVSYYGTDAAGRQMRSGAQNPLNFQAFSGSGVSSAMRRSFNNVQDGRNVDNDGLEPAQ